MGVYGGPERNVSIQSASGRSLYSSGVVQDGLILNLDAGKFYSYPQSGTTWTDLSGNGNTGTLTNGPTYNSVNGGVIVFDGSNDYVSGTISNLTEYTLCAMVKVLTSVVGGGIMGGNNGSSAYLQLGGNPNPPWQFNNAVNISISPVLSQWAYVVGVQASGSSQLLYLNGSSIASASGTSNLGTAYAIGRRELATIYLNCQIGVSQIYNKGLSSAEITQNFNALRSRFGI
jgi:hypothetical protein